MYKHEAMACIPAQNLGRSQKKLDLHEKCTIQAPRAGVPPHKTQYRHHCDVDKRVGPKGDVEGWPLMLIGSATPRISQELHTAQ